MMAISIRFIDGRSLKTPSCVNKMKPRIVKARSLQEYLTPERCFVYENWGSVSANDSKVSIARARVEAGVSTKPHHLEGVQEIYLITKGCGKVQIGALEPTEVTEGDVIVVPPGVSQQITNIGETDLLFYCICTPAFTESCYRNEEE
jgi:mannose-6-phosphate isomerase-like protein (cupin superfamily)